MSEEKGKVFLIEDDVSIVDIYSAAFKAAGLSFDVATTGKQALEMLKQIQDGKTEKPALVLLDLVLPDVNGLELLLNIRENAVTKDMIVFVFSSYNSDALHNMQYIKPDRYIVKSSMTPTELTNLIKQQINGH